MGSLLARITEAAGTQRGPRCTVAVVLAKLDGSDRTDLEHALENRDVTASAIFRVLREDGHNIGDQAIGRHRRGECACGRTS